MTAPPAFQAPTPEQARVLLSTLTRALCVVAVLSGIFTAVNVTLFAATRGVPGPIAILLDPMVGLALATVLYADARLAAYGLRPPIWSAALRWFTGLVATAMNTWTSIWPTDHPGPADPAGTTTAARPIGWPTEADPAGILLHATPTVLLIGLTETIAAYRRVLTHHLQTPSSNQPADPADHPEVNGTGTAHDLDKSTTIGSSDRVGEDSSTAAPLAPPGAPATTARAGHWRSPIVRQKDIDAAQTAPATRVRSAVADGGAVWQQAFHIDAAHRSRTGRSASVWRLRTELHLGPARARRLHEQLRQHHGEQTEPDDRSGRHSRGRT